MREEVLGLAAVLADHLTEARSLTRLALPLVLGQMAHAGVGFTDTLMVGRLGGLELAGVALGSSLYFFAFILCSGILFSVAPSVSQAFGAGRERDALHAARQGIWLALFFALPVVVLLFLSEGLLLSTGQDPEVAAIAANYLRVIAPGFLPMLLTVALRGFLEGKGDTRPLMFILLLGLGVKIALNSVLLTGGGPFPALGVSGAAISSVAVYTVEFLAAALYISRRYRSLQLFGALGRPHAPQIIELIRVGVPIGLTLGFETGLFTVTAFLMGTLGGPELAAHQVALQSAGMAFNIPLGLALATSVRVGYSVGRADRAGAALAGRVGVLTSVLAMTVTALIFALVPEQVASLFLDASDPRNAEVVALAVRFLGFAAMFQLVDGIQVTASGALRGYKDTRVPMLASLVSYWVFGLGISLWLLYGVGMGGAGLWIGLVAGLAMAALLLSLRLAWRGRQPVGPIFSVPD